MTRKPILNTLLNKRLREPSFPMKWQLTKKVPKRLQKFSSKTKMCNLSKNPNHTMRILPARSLPKKRPKKICHWRPRTKWRSSAEIKSGEALTKVPRFMWFPPWNWGKIDPLGWLSGGCPLILMTLTRTLALNSSLTARKIQTAGAPTPQISAREPHGEGWLKVAKLTVFWTKKTPSQVLTPTNQAQWTISQEQWIKGQITLTNQLSQNPSKWKSEQVRKRSRRNPRKWQKRRFWTI